MGFIDVHTHLDHPMFKDDIQAVLENAKNAGLLAILSNGINPKSNRVVLAMAKQFDIIKPALGIHPEDAHAAMRTFDRHEGEQFPFLSDSFDIDEELAFIKKNKNRIIAIGECGLDLHWIKDYLEEQIGIFKKQIKLSFEIKKPLIVHTRNAEKESLDILEDMKAKHVLLHSFGGSKKMVKRASDLGYFMSIPPNITRSSHFKMVAKMVNINFLLSETDAPFLGPIKDERNEPMNVTLVIDEIAKIKGFTKEDTKNNIWLNYQRLFL